MTDDDLRDIQRRNRAVLYFIMTVIGAVCAASEISKWLS